MKLPRGLARFNKRVTNPIQRRWAPYVAPWAMVSHIGRKSGTRYRIPVLAWVDGDKVSIVLGYGRNSDWVRNVEAAGGFEMTRRGRHLRVVNPRVVASDSPDIAAGARSAARRVEHVLTGTITEETA
jgi:deazaflavin-dependent oxidoreductase (nitroreductase family)